MAKLGMQQSYTTAQNANQNQMDMIKAAMAQGATYQDAVNQVMGTGGQQNVNVDTLQSVIQKADGKSTQC